MKRIINIFFGILLFFQGYSQISDRDKINYQAVVVDNIGMIVVNTTVGVKISLLEGSETGAVIYAETHTGMTDEQGLLTLEIGGGTSVTGQYDSIDWSGTSYFFKTEVDLEGGTDYTLMGTQKTTSVPFALYTKSATESDPVFSSSVAGGITSTDTTIWNNKQNQLIAGEGISIKGDTIKNDIHYIGELFGGGIIVWLDETGEHGLILAMVDLSTNSPWSNVTDEIIETTNFWNGPNNTIEIISQTGHTNSAAQLCADYTNEDYGTGIYDDWYLPSYAEWLLILPNFYFIQRTIKFDNNSESQPIIETVSYWSSTVIYDTKAFAFDISKLNRPNHFTIANKSESYYVRAMRTF